MTDITVKCLCMEYGIHEMLVKNHDDSYTIFLNARDTHAENMKSYKHAIRHIENDDFSKYDIQEIEYDNHLYD